MGVTKAVGDEFCLLKVGNYIRELIIMSGSSHTAVKTKRWYKSYGFAFTLGSFGLLVGVVFLVQGTLDIVVGRFEE